VNVFQSLHDYEDFIYRLSEYYLLILRSTLVIIPRGKHAAVLRGELVFTQGYRLLIRERLAYDDGPVFIEFYSYELWHNADKFTWYDSQPHPDDPSLASTHPHHKHVPPDIKHHRVPAPGMSFTQPNLPLLIQEMETLIAGSPSGDETIS
jgi:hypothetical protein